MGFHFLYETLVFWAGFVKKTKKICCKNVEAQEWWSKLKQKFLAFSVRKVENALQISETNKDFNGLMVTINGLYSKHVIAVDILKQPLISGEVSILVVTA